MRRSVWAYLIAATTALLFTAPGYAQTPTTASPLIVPDRDATPPLSATGQITDYTLTVTCSGREVEILRKEAAAPILTTAASPYGVEQRSPQAIHLDFSIAPDGRAYSIRKTVEAPAAPVPIIMSSSDSSALQATLMGWRFAPVEHADCELEAQPISTPLKDAALSLTARAMALGVNRTTWGAALQRAMERPGDDCRRRPAFRTSVNGDPEIKPPPGAMAWGAYRFDVDAEGRIQNIESLDASPDPDVEAVWRQAIGASDFYPGHTKTGCVVAFVRAGETPPPGSIPMPDWRGLNRCTVEQRARFRPGTLVYPEPLRARGIEGWALVRYDLASWGRVGGVEVLQSQPVGAFGEQARQIVLGGRVTPALEHATQCVDRVIFRLSNENRETTDAN